MCNVLTVIVLVCNADGMAQLMDGQEYGKILLQLIACLSLLLQLHIIR